MARRLLFGVSAYTCLAGCGQLTSDGATTFTLYRNSFVDHSMRVQWATFDAPEKDPNYNRNNCEMAARVLNANVDASAKVERKPRDASMGFWCESGAFKEKGGIPSSFPAAFPTDA